MFFIRKVHKI